MTRETRVLILGCGPSGLLATEQAEEMGFKKTKIYSVKEKSYIAGAQFLLGYKDDGSHHARIDVEKWGTKPDFAEKVYGRPDADSPVWDRYYGRQIGLRAWNMKDVYGILWNRFAYRVHSERLGGIEDLSELLYDLQPDVTISTIPLIRLCKDPAHGFSWQRVFIRQQETGEMGRNLILNGEPSPGWFRKVNLFGHECVEYSSNMKKPPIEGIKDIRRPLSTNCDCLSEQGVVLMGRYGTWNHSFTVHDVQKEVENVLAWRH